MANKPDKDRRSTGRALVSGLGGPNHLMSPDTDPLAGIELSREQMRSVLGKVGVKAVGKIFPVVSKLIEIIEDANAEVREEKLSILLNSYASRFATHEDAFKAIQNLLSQRVGLILMQKVIHIADSGSADEEWLSLLGNVLKSVSDADLGKQFEEISYVLAQIAKLSPQALLVLSRHETWRAVRITGTTTTSGQTASGDWDIQASQFLGRSANITDEGTKARISHAFRDLMSAGLLQLEGERLVLAAIGQEVFDHIHSS